MKMQAQRFLLLILFSDVNVFAAVEATKTSSTGLATKWEAKAGPGVVVKPTYSGSDSFATIPFPFVDVSYGDTLQASVIEGIHLYLWRSGGFSADFGAGYDFLGRPESADSDLEGMGDIDPSSYSTARISYSNYVFGASLQAKRNIGPDVKGNSLYAATYGQMPLAKKLFIRTELSVNWQDEALAETHYGVTEEQSSNSGYEEFSPEAGIEYVGLEQSMFWMLSSRWSIVGLIGADLLMGNAAESPLVADAGHVAQWSYTAIGSYKL